MFLPPSTYQLLDFGAGRKLERVGGVILDRPSPAAEGISKQQPALWREALFAFGMQGEKDWQHRQALPQPWRFNFAEVQLILRPTPFGHIGVFPEQQINWQWFSQLTAVPVHSKRCLNLFAYTGASTLALAKAGWQVTHVDASRPTLLWARDNAAASGLSESPIRWIQEDALLFVEREVRRGNRYDLVLLDPPSYGHGPKGEAWNFERDMASLLNAVFGVLVASPVGVLWTGHSESELLRPMLREVKAEAERLQLVAEKIERATLADLKGRELDFGYRVRWLNPSLVHR
jgi:23S rRNA (cytosine1962-C5)-methyltransferase